MKRRWNQGDETRRTSMCHVVEFALMVVADLPFAMAVAMAMASQSNKMKINAHSYWTFF